MKMLHATKKIISLILVLSLVFAMASCDLFAGSLKLESFTVVKSSVKTTYYVGESIDFSGIKAEVTYSDESLNKVYTAADLTVEYPDDITATVGTKTVKVSFMDPNLNVKQETTVTIIVQEDPNAPKHAGYKVDTTDMKTDYLVGETIDFTGIKVFETFTNGGADVEMTDLSKVEYVYDSNITAEHGIATITVKYNGESAGTITVNVTDPTLNMVKITSIEVAGEFDRNYEIGSTTNFAGLYVIVTYEDGQVKEVPFSAITVGTVDTATAGEKDVVVSFKDPINNAGATASFKIIVIKAKEKVDGFEKPASLVNFDNKNKNAGSANYGDTNFSGQFLNGAVYVIGDDNEFKLVPVFSVDNGSSYEQLAAFYMNVEVALNGTALTKETDSVKPTVVHYYNGETLIVTVDTFFGTYQFTPDAVGSSVTISVLPSAEHYVFSDLNPVTLTADIIDAYNVYEAWQLAVIEHTIDQVDKDGDTDSRRDDWDAFKKEHGIENVHPAGIVFHKDIHISASDVPAHFFHITETETVYKNSSTGEIKTAPKGTKYLEDGTVIYQRNGADDFTIQGNLFTLDLQSFPIVASPSVFNPELDWDYGKDFSNSVLFAFDTVGDNYEYDEPTEKAINTIENLQVVGNAGRNNYVDADGNLASGGGLILVKVRRFAEGTFTNMLTNSFFITFFPDAEGLVNMDQIKCYDSFQNAMFLWGNAVCNLTNSYFNGAGGPLVIALSDDSDEDVNYYNPSLNATNVVAENHLTGEELWFSAMNATTVVGGIKAIGGGLQQAGLGNIVDKDGNMNVIAILMNEGTNAEAMIGAVKAQGEFWFDGEGIGRWADDPYWQMLYPNLIQGGNLVPFFTVHDSKGIPYTIYFDGANFRNAANNEAISSNMSAETMAVYAAFAQADRLVLTQGGLSALLEFYH